MSTKVYPWYRLLALFLGPLLGLMPLLVAAPSSLSTDAWRLAWFVAWMALWWLTEAVPIPVTSLLPLVWMPWVGIANQKAVAVSYGHPLIFLFLGGFLMAYAMESWNLHRRIALSIVRFLGTSPHHLVGGFMLATALMSMWITNTATTTMMFAVAVSLIDYLKSKQEDPRHVRNFAVYLLLGIAYSASIGGLGTLVGTVPNTYLAGFLAKNYKLQISFLQWMKIGVPAVLLLLPLTWIWLRFVFPLKELNVSGVDRLIDDELHQMGSMKREESLVLGVFCLTAFGWMFRKLITKYTGIPLSDPSIAMFGAIVLFMIPSSLKEGKFLLDWSVSKRLPWGILLLFGGGLAIATGFKKTGLAKVLGQGVASISNISIVWILLLVVLLIVFLTELTSNTATTITFLPIMAAAAIGMKENPLLLLIPVTISASAAFMMPVATPPNAIVFASPELELKDMVRAGFGLNLIAVVVIFLIAVYWAPYILGVEVGVLPSWAK